MCIFILIVNRMRSFKVLSDSPENMPILLEFLGI
jgi:hypothetical protein